MIFLPEAIQSQYPLLNITVPQEPLRDTLMQPVVVSADGGDLTGWIRTERERMGDDYMD